MHNKEVIHLQENKFDFFVNMPLECCVLGKTCFYLNENSGARNRNAQNARAERSGEKCGLQSIYSEFMNVIFTRTIRPAAHVRSRSENCQ